MTIKEVVDMVKAKQPDDIDPKIKDLEKQLRETYGDNLFDDAKIQLIRSEKYAGLNVLIDEMKASLTELESLGYKKPSQKIKSYDYETISKNMAKFVYRAKTYFPKITDWIYFDAPFKTYGSYEAGIAHLSVLCQTFRRIVEGNEDIAILKLRISEITQSYTQGKEGDFERQNKELTEIKKQNEELSKVNIKLENQLSEMNNRITQMELDIEHLLVDKATLEGTIKNNDSQIVETTKSANTIKGELLKETMRADNFAKQNEQLQEELLKLNLHARRIGPILILANPNGKEIYQHNMETHESITQGKKLDIREYKVKKVNCSESKQPIILLEHKVNRNQKIELPESIYHGLVKEYQSINEQIAVQKPELFESIKNRIATSPKFSDVINETFSSIIELVASNPDKKLSERGWADLAGVDSKTIKKYFKIMEALDIMDMDSLKNNLPGRGANVKCIWYLTYEQ